MLSIQYGLERQVCLDSGLRDSFNMWTEGTTTATTTKKHQMREKERTFVLEYTPKEKAK